MASLMVPVDQWVWLIPGTLEVFVRADQLTDPDYRTRWEVSADPFHVRCLSPLPAGYWIRGHGLDVAFPELLDPVDDTSTQEFRAVPVDEQTRVISEDVIRRARENRLAREARK